MFKSTLKKIVNHFGYDIQHLPTDPLVRKRLDLMRQYQVNLVFDIGANTGQFASRLRDLGYRDRIISFEPLTSAYRLLREKASHDPLWQTVNIALGDVDGEADIHISENSYSSSILDILPEHVESAPDSVFTGTEKIAIKALDNIIDAYFNPGDRLFVKIDTQGYESKVLEGCHNSLDKIVGFQMELSLIPLYANETLIQDMTNHLRNLGYRLKLIETGHMNYETGEILQVEGYFFR